MATVETPKLLTVDEAAARLRQSRHTLYRKIAAGELEAVRLGENGPLRVPEDALAAHLRPTSSSPSVSERSVPGDHPLGELDAETEEER